MKEKDRKKERKKKPTKFVYLNTDVNTEWILSTQQLSTGTYYIFFLYVALVF